MKIRKSKFYDSFRCIASACPDSCCQDWAVTIDETSRKLYLSLPGDLGDILRQNIMEEEGETILQIRSDGRCPMWREDGLCRIQAELGENALSCVCTQFPRLTHDYGDFREWGLELSCPEAARLIFSSSWEWTETDTAESGTGEYDEDVMDILKSTRETMMDYIRNPQYTVGEALTVALMYGYHVQAMIDGEDTAVFDADASLSAAREAAKPWDERNMLPFFEELNILRPRWKMRLENPEKTEIWDEKIRNLAIYFLDRYYLQAVSDFDLVCRVKLMVISCLAIRCLGGDLVQTAQEYSKEIENDTENLDAVLDAAYREPAFADVRLLGCLLEKTGG